MPNDSKDIFVSWSTPDKESVDRLVNRMQDTGLSVLEYSRKIDAGEEIRRWVSEMLDKSAIAVLCISSAALNSRWIEYEASLIAERRERGRIDSIVVRIGPVPDDQLPGMLQGDRFAFFDTSVPPTEEELLALVQQLRNRLGMDAPIVLPTALYSMTAAEFEEIEDIAGADQQALRSRLIELCHQVGMTDEPELWTGLRGRYGEASEDFSPFIDGQPLKHLAQKVVHEINVRRRSRGLQPLYLRWFSRAELKTGEARDRWRRSGHTLLLVDSVSVLHSTLAGELLSVPHPGDSSRAAFVWLPPYTRHTGSVEQLIEQVLNDNLFLGDNVRDWRTNDARPYLAFDIPSETSFRRWLAHFLLTVETGPLPDLLRAMNRGQPPADVPAFPHAPGR